MKLWWLDLETTGLDPTHDQILEIAVAEADLQAPFDLGRRYHAVLHFPLAGILQLPPVIREMHTRNGLLAECAGSATTLAEVETELLSLLLTTEDVPEAPALAGSSVHFDHKFLRAQLPFVAARFSHRHYDVSAVKLFARSMGMPRLPRAEAHRAVADIEESVAHGRACWDWFEGRESLAMRVAPVED